MYGHARPDLTSWRKRGDNSILLTAVTTIAYCMYVNIAMYTGGPDSPEKAQLCEISYKFVQI